MTIDQIALWTSAAEAFDIRHQLITAEDQHSPTPCDEFDVAALVNHATGAQVGLGQIFGSKAQEGASWAEARDAMAAALATPGSIDGTMEHPLFGEVSKERMLAIATNDILIHAWDLSRALGVDETLPEQNLQPAIDGIEAFEPQAREMLFGPPLETEASASLQNKMLAVAGRQV